MADRKPTLPEMLAVPKNDGSKVNIVEQIGTKYETFGILLLRDDNGQLVSNIKYDNKENGVESIVTAIIREWLFGRGKLPVSWKTLIEILREMNLKILADDVEGFLKNCSATSSHSNPLASRKRKLNPSPEEATGHDSMAIAETKKLKPIAGHPPLQLIVSIPRSAAVRTFIRFADRSQPPLGTSLPSIGVTPLPLRATGLPPVVDAPPLIVSIPQSVIFNQFADKPQPPSGTSLPPIGGTPLPLRVTATGLPPVVDAPPLNPPLQLTAEKPELQLIPWRDVYYNLRDGLGQPDAIKNILAPEKFDPTTLGRSISQICFQASQGKCQTILSTLTRHPCFSHAKCFFEGCGENVETDPLAAVPTMIMCSRSADDVYSLLTSLNKCCDSPEVTQAFYYLAALFLSLSAGIGKGVFPPRYHYLVLCSLSTLEQNLSQGPFFGQQSITQYMPGRTPLNVVNRPSGSSMQKKGMTPKPTAHKPTAEQMRVLEHPITEGKVFRVTAHAGTGKTFVLTKIVEKYQQSDFLYLVYNKSARNEAKRLFTKYKERVKIQTVHSLAYEKVVKGTTLEDKILTSGEVGVVQIADYLNHGKKIGAFEDQRTIKLASYVMKTLMKFFSSSDGVITTKHVPTLECEESKYILDDKENYQQQVQSTAAKVWGKMSDPEDRLRISHDGYLKLYQLSSPTLVFDCILVDEAQDFNPVMQSILEKQRCAKILVGDPHQQIYRFRGAVNAMDALAADKIAHLTQSFRFGPTIGYIASCVLTMKMQEQTRIDLAIGNIGNKDMVVTDAYPKGPKAIICRRNSTLFDEMVAVCTSDPSKPVKIGYPGGISKFGLSRIRDIYYLMKGNKDNIGSGFIERFGSVANLLRYAHIAENLELIWKVLVCQKYQDRTPLLITEIEKRSGIWKTADVVFATAHKAKGLEFDTVQLGNDFFEKKNEEDKLEEDEVNVLYVAVTRARRNLILSKDLALFLAIKMKEEFIFPVNMGQRPSDEDSECPNCGSMHTTFPKFEKLRLALSNGECIPGGLVCKECLLKVMPFFKPMM